MKAKSKSYFEHEYVQRQTEVVGSKTSEKKSYLYYKYEGSEMEAVSGDESRGKVGN